MERSCNSYSLSTSTLDGGEKSMSRHGRYLAAGKGPSVPIVQEAGWAPEADLDTEATVKFLSHLPGIELLSPDPPVRSQALH
jgi:hypothetical protein